jgi:hypothetical protein
VDWREEVVQPEFFFAATHGADRVAALLVTLPHFSD